MDVYLVERFDYEMKDNNPMPITQLYYDKADALAFYHDQLDSTNGEFTELTNDQDDLMAVCYNKKVVTDLLLLRKLKVR